MRAVLLLVAVAAWSVAAGSADSPRSADHVNDYAGVLIDGDRAALEKTLGDLNRKFDYRVVLLTVGPDAETGGRDLRRYALDLYDGMAPGKGNFGLILFSRVENAMWIELGSGVDHTRKSDVEVVVRNVMQPAFNRGDYSRGLREGVEALVPYLSGKAARHRWYLLMFVVAGALFFVALHALRRGAGRGLPWLCGLADFLVFFPRF